MYCLESNYSKLAKPQKRERGCFKHREVPGKSEVPDIISQKEFSDKVIDKKWIYLKKNTLHRQRMSHLRKQESPEIWH